MEPVNQWFFAQRMCSPSWKRVSGGIGPPGRGGGGGMPLVGFSKAGSWFTTAAFSAERFVEGLGRWAVRLKAWRMLGELLVVKEHWEEPRQFIPLLGVWEGGR